MTDAVQEIINTAYLRRDPRCCWALLAYFYKGRQHTRGFRHCREQYVSASSLAWWEKQRLLFVRDNVLSTQGGTR